MSMCSASHPSSRAMTDAMRRAKHFFPEKRISAVPRSERPDLARLGEVDDVLVLRVAGPGDVGLPGFERSTDRVHARDELAVVAEHFERSGSHAGHVRIETAT